MDMEKKHVKDIMIPLKDYAVVSQDTTIEEALKDKGVHEFITTTALSVDVNQELVHAIHILQTSGHRGLLVTGEGKKPIGMLRLTDIYQRVKETLLGD